jgi:hypothetical protein
MTDWRQQFTAVMMATVALADRHNVVVRGKMPVAVEKVAPDRAPSASSVQHGDE